MIRDEETTTGLVWEVGREREREREAQKHMIQD